MSEGFRGNAGWILPVVIIAAAVGLFAVGNIFLAILAVVAGGGILISRLMQKGGRAKSSE
jgi:hypothetical protein